MERDYSLNPGLVAAVCMTLAADHRRHFAGSNLICAITGDGFGRIRTGMQMYFDGIAPHYAIIGPDSLLNEPKANLNAEGFKAWVLQQMGHEDQNVIAINGGQYTNGQAKAFVELVQQRGWHKAILVVSAFHLPRAFSTVLKYLQKARLDDHFTLIPHAVQEPWTQESREMTVSPTDWFSRFMNEEYRRINTYSQKDKPDCATWEEMAAYVRSIEL